MISTYKLRLYIHQNPIKWVPTPHLLNSIEGAGSLIKPIVLKTLYYIDQILWRLGLKEQSIPKNATQFLYSKHTYNSSKIKEVFPSLGIKNWASCFLYIEVLTHSYWI